MCLLVMMQRGFDGTPVPLRHGPPPLDHHGRHPGAQPMDHAAQRIARPETACTRWLLAPLRNDGNRVTIGDITARTGRCQPKNPRRYLTRDGVNPYFYGLHLQVRSVILRQIRNDSQRRRVEGQRSTIDHPVVGIPCLPHPVTAETGLLTAPACQRPVSLLTSRPPPTSAVPLARSRLALHTDSEHHPERIDV